MQVRNDSITPTSFTVRMNPKATVKVQSEDGREITRMAMPVLKTVNIPAKATIEVDDDLWSSAWGARTTVPIYDYLEEKVDTGIKDETKQVSIKIPMATGKSRTIYPLREMVKSGQLVIVKAAELKLTREEVLAAVVKAGFPVSKDIDDQKLRDLYDTVVS